MKFFILALAFLSFNSYSQSLSEVVTPLIQELQKKLEAGAYEQMALNAHIKKARNESFRLQAIGRMFSKEAKIFKSFKGDMKNFEDHLGQIGKWSDLLNQQNLTPNQVQFYQQNYQNELRALAIFLEDSNFKVTLNNYLAAINNLNFDEARTKAIVFKSIKAEIHEVLEKRYDFTYGETGLHEFRRNIRWPIMELDTFKNYFTTDKRSCPNSINFQYGAKSLYASVKANPKASFKVNYCPYIELVGAVEYIGVVKDGLEKQGLLEEKVSSDIYQFSLDMEKEVKSNVLPKIF
ncbi:MAG: hypothetical protein AB7I27_13365 [Bacteriovoracaceae bacterium]